MSRSTSPAYLRPGRPCAAAVCSSGRNLKLRELRQSRNWSTGLDQLVDQANALECIHNASVDLRLTDKPSIILDLVAQARQVSNEVLSQVFLPAKALLHLVLISLGHNPQRTNRYTFTTILVRKQTSDLSMLLLAPSERVQLSSPHYKNTLLRRMIGN